MECEVVRHKLLLLAFAALMQPWGCIGVPDVLERDPCDPAYTGPLACGRDAGGQGDADGSRDAPRDEPDAGEACCGGDAAAPPLQRLPCGYPGA